MPRKPNPKPTDPEQSKRFLETAKAVDAEKTGALFEKALGIIGVRKSLTRTSEKIKKKQ